MSTSVDPWDSPFVASDAEYVYCRAYCYAYGPSRHDLARQYAEYVEAAYRRDPTTKDTWDHETEYVAWIGASASTGKDPS